MSTDYVFFDLGNVLFHFDHQVACQRLAEDLGLATSKVQAKIFESGLQTQYETGLIGDEEFVAAILADCSKSLPPETVLRYCSDIFSLNLGIVHLVAELKNIGFRHGILSNTCRAHWEFLDSGHFGLLRDLFRERILSYEEQSMKPDAKIYNAAIELAGCPAESIFFTDDREENVEGARRAGIDAELFVDTRTLKQQLIQRGVL